MFAYPVILERDSDGSFVARFPDVPEAITFGATKAEALEHAVDALETALSLYIDDSRPLPKVSTARGRATVAPTLIGSLKLGLYQSMKQRNIRKTDLARRMGVALMQIDRLLDLTHHSRVDQLEAAYAALSIKVGLSLETA